MTEADNNFFLRGATHHQCATVMSQLLQQSCLSGQLLWLSCPLTPQRAYGNYGICHQKRKGVNVCAQVHAGVQRGATSAPS